ncbi:hypothetical protein EVAR_102924_1 [Eumeta japonica]|uniref:Uncharacterized protein n=1 Tax=Eumeta variegata TaxID=151549 RepID=A0A4C2A5U7_EUMVA|nr:hypothetical protein EVAR_102924_1 [Eumeta japonica]
MNPGFDHRLIPASTVGCRRSANERSCMKCKVHDHAPSINIYADGYAIYKLQRNCCIHLSCTPAATCEARAAINKSDHLKTLSIILPTCRMNPYSETTVKEIRSASLRGGAEIAVTNTEMYRFAQSTKSMLNHYCVVYDFKNYYCC